MDRDERILYALDEIDDWLQQLGDIFHNSPDLGEYALPASMLRAGLTELNEELRPSLETPPAPPAGA